MNMLRNRYVQYAVVIAVALLAAQAYVSVDVMRHGRTVISRLQLKDLDPANEGINIEVTEPWLNGDSVVVFNVGKPKAERDFNRWDVMRCLLQCSQQLLSRDFSRIYLASDGTRLYYIEANDFKRLGENYQAGDNLNTLSLCVELPRVTHTLNDSMAFPANTGLLGAIGDAQDWNTMMGHLMR